MYLFIYLFCINVFVSRLSRLDADALRITSVCDPFIYIYIYSSDAFIQMTLTPNPVLMHLFQQQRVKGSRSESPHRGSLTIQRFELFWSRVPICVNTRSDVNVSFILIP